MKKRFISALLMFIGFFLAYAAPVIADPWKEEFDRLCGYVEQAESLSTDELNYILADCDTLMGTLQELDAPEKKVYIFRLEKCMKFYRYIIELREQVAEEEKTK